MSAAASTTPLSAGVRGRTRQAVIEAAVTVLARDRSATLADIAEAAAVGRSTLHRYFPDRDELIRTVASDAQRMIRQAMDDAAPDQDPPLEAMHRLVDAMVSVGDRIVLLYGDPRMAEQVEGDDAEPIDGPILDLIRRGQADGTFAPDVSPGWIESVLWALVYSGCEAAARGVLPRHGISSTVVRTLDNGIRPRRVAAADTTQEGDRW